MNFFSVSVAWFFQLNNYWIVTSKFHFCMLALFAWKAQLRKLS